MNNTREPVRSAIPIPSASGAAARICPEAFIANMRGELEQVLRGVAQAVNAAPHGRWIEGSEHPVRDLMAAWRERVFQQALQMRVDAAEAAFSPSAQRDHGQAPGGQGPR